jgi:uncharacterized membrane protein YebE (DUF533 family)
MSALKVAIAVAGVAAVGTVAYYGYKHYQNKKAVQEAAQALGLEPGAAGIVPAVEANARAAGKAFGIPQRAAADKNTQA